MIITDIIIVYSGYYNNLQTIVKNTVIPNTIH